MCWGLSKSSCNLAKELLSTIQLLPSKSEENFSPLAVAKDKSSASNEHEEERTDDADVCVNYHVTNTSTLCIHIHVRALGHSVTYTHSYPHKRTPSLFTLTNTLLLCIIWCSCRRRIRKIKQHLCRKPRARCFAGYCSTSKMRGCAQSAWMSSSRLYSVHAVTSSAASALGS